MATSAISSTAHAANAIRHSTTGPTAVGTSVEDVRTERAPEASRHPPTMPASDTSTLSAARCRSTCQRPAPRAVRMLISRTREVARARVRLLMFRHVIISTITVSMAMPAASVHVFCRSGGVRKRSAPEYGSSHWPGSTASGRMVANRPSVACEAALATAGVMPARSRPYICTVCVAQSVLRSLAGWKSSIRSIGIQTRETMSACSPGNRASATPATTAGRPFRRTVRPMRSGRPPNCCRQNR